MRNNFWQETVVSLVLLVLLVLALNPLDLWMPDAMTMMLVSGLVLVALLFGSLVWRERAADERENLHRLLQARCAYLAGAAVLLFAVTIQIFRHALDPWLVLALGAMVLAKVAGSVYGRIRR